MLELKRGEHKKGNFASILAITAPSHLREAGLEQFHQILWTLVTVSIAAASDVCVRKSFFCFFWKTGLTAFLNDSTFLQRILAKKRASAKRALPKSVSIIKKALIFVDWIVHKSERMANEGLLA